MIKKTNREVDFQPHVKNAINSMISQVKFLESSDYPEFHSFQLKNFGTSEKVDNKWLSSSYDLPSKGNRVLYLFRMIDQFSCKNDFEAFLSKVFEGANGFRNEHSQITGVNKSKKVAQKLDLDDIVIYIGTSEKFSQRLKEHIGFGSKGTATLCLRSWEPLVSRDKVLTVEYYNFGDEILSESLKLIEHSLSDELKPIFGRNRKA